MRPSPRLELAVCLCLVQWVGARAFISAVGIAAEEAWPVIVTAKDVAPYQYLLSPTQVAPAQPLPLQGGAFLDHLLQVLHELNHRYAVHLLALVLLQNFTMAGKPAVTVTS